MKGNAGLAERSDRPDDKLPYGGAWLNIGTEMIHLMELPNPDVGAERPEHGGRDRHFCIGIEEDAMPELMATLDSAGARRLRLCAIYRSMVCVTAYRSNRRWCAMVCTQLGWCKTTAAATRRTSSAALVYYTHGHCTRSHCFVALNW